MLGAGFTEVEGWKRLGDRGLEGNGMAAATALHAAVALCVTRDGAKAFVVADGRGLLERAMKIPLATPMLRWDKGGCAGARVWHGCVWVRVCVSVGGVYVSCVCPACDCSARGSGSCR